MGHLYHTSYSTASMFHADDMNPPLSSIDGALIMTKGNCMHDAGNISWDTTVGALSWSLPMKLIVIDPDTGQLVLNTLASGSLTIPALNIAYIDVSTVSGATLSATYSTISTASTAIVPKNRLILGSVNTALQFFPRALSVPLDNMLNAASTVVYPHSIDSSAAHTSTAGSSQIFIASTAGTPIGSGRQLSEYMGARESSLTCGAAMIIDFSTAETRFLTLTTNATAVITGGQNGYRYQLRVQQDATGNWTLALGATTNSIRWEGGVAPTITTAATHSDFIILRRSNGTWFGSVNQNF